MKGDFSKWHFDRNNNFNGVLHQQGRVLLDSDWNDQTKINSDWQDKAGQDIIGQGVAAVPADEYNNFKVMEAKAELYDHVHVELIVIPGKIWADGLPLTLPSEKSHPAYVKRLATYFPSRPPDPAENIRDMVFLEVWREAINGFQLPNLLIEPALAGPDTTERVHTAVAFRLLRLNEDDTCYNIAEKLKDDFNNKGKLTVSLRQGIPPSKDCPVAESGGYSGLEHNLYRIEIADINDPSRPMFKWSQFNGGLVGRGIFDATNNKVTITANLQAIVTSNIDEFYLEAGEYDSDLGYWKVTYGAKVTLNNENELELPGHPTFGSVPVSSEPVFFRLWNGIRYIDEFPKPPAIPEPRELRDGIRLEFDTPTASNYKHGDFWTFPVRAGGINNETPLIDEELPEGIHYHRVPLAILKWNRDLYAKFPGNIDDCRTIFRPLTNLSLSSFTISCNNVPEKKWPKLKCEMGDLLFLAGEPTAAKPDEPPERMRIRTNGNVGIGVMSPAAQLAIKGNLSSALAGTVAVIKNSTNVIGTNTTFTTDLAVGDSIKIGLEIFTVLAIALDTSLTLDSAYQGATASGLTLYRDPTLFAIDNGDAVNKLTITRSGNVGIGTTSPRNPLGIRAGGVSEELISFEDPNGITKWHINQNLSGNKHGLNFVETGVADGRLFIQAGGNIGIGTPSPENAEGWSKVLDILGGTTTKLSVRTTNIDARVLSHEKGWWGAPAGMIIGTKTAHPLSFGTNAASRMTIDQNGNVGIRGNLQVNGQVGSVVTGTGTTDTNALYASASCSGSGESKGLSISASNTGTGFVRGLRVDASGTAYAAGMEAFAHSSGSAYVYGIYANAWNSGTGPVYGIFAEAFGGGTGTKYAGYFTASGGGTSYAGYFEGNVYVGGSLTKTHGGFLIDHPLDPYNKTLRHGFVESPEDLCLYRGKIRLDLKGRATVKMPEYFPILTKEEEATVTLTPIGKKPILLSYEWNSKFTAFTIFGEPGAQAAYIVLADRDDPSIQHLRRPVEEEKGNGHFEKGKLLFPEAYGQPREIKAGPHVEEYRP